jgi:DNA-directed RNA polymerase specialized sigma24 family protein
MPIDSANFARAYERCHERTIRLLCKKGLRFEDAQDFAQLAWARAWERRTQLRNSSQLASWVSSIALNEFRAYHCETCREELLDVSDIPWEPQLFTHRLIEELFGSSRYAATLRAFYILGYSVAEIGRFQKTSGVAVRVRLSRARTALRPLLAPAP